MLKRIFSITILALGVSSQAQTLQVGGHIGAVGGSQASSEIAYGAHLTSNPYSMAGFRIDATAANFSGGTYFSTSPAVVFYPVDFDEMKLGVLVGAGFHRRPSDKTRFAVNYGVLGDFSLSKTLSVGFDTRAHSIFDVEDLWTVFLTMGFRFELDGGW
jgi:hypothetical protein